MSQHDFTIANDTGANVRGDIEDALQALASNSYGGTEPTTTYAGMWYLNGNDMYVRNTADTAWIRMPFAIDASLTLGPGVTPVQVASGGFQFTDSSLQTTAYPGRNTYANWSTNWSTTSTTWADVGGTGSGFDCTISPISSTDKVFVSIKLCFSYSTTSQEDAPLLRVVRDLTTPLNTGSNGGYEDVSFAYATATEISGYVTEPDETLYVATCAFVDAPSTTSVTRYSVQVKLPSNVTSFTTNETENSVGSYGTIGGESSIVLMTMPASAS